MERRKFIPCLNRQRKIYNLNYGSFIGMFIFGFIGLGLKGLFGALGAGTVGFLLGRWINNLIFSGELQKAIYWYFPGAKKWLDSNIPDSADRNEL